MLAHRRNRRGAPPRSLSLVVILLTVALSAGCGGTDDETAQDDPSPTDTTDVASPAASPATDVASPTEPVAASPPQVPAEEATPLATWVEVAVADFAERDDVEGENVTVATAERVTWRDGSLGCPEEGRVYTQALVDGYRIILEANGQRAAYHGRTGEEPTFCPDPAANGTVDR